MIDRQTNKCALVQRKPDYRQVVYSHYPTDNEKKRQTDK